MTLDRNIPAEPECPAAPVAHRDGDGEAQGWIPPLSPFVIALLIGVAGGALAALWLKLIELNGS